MSLAGLAVVALVLLFQVPPLIRAVVVGARGADEPGRMLAGLLTAHEDQYQVYQDRFNGRSMFYQPRGWPPAPRVETSREDPVVEVVQEDTPSDPTPSVPSSYEGPPIAFIVGDVVWFSPIGGGDDGEHPFSVRTGHEREGITVVGTNPPWAATLGYRGGEYVVAYLEGGPDFFRSLETDPDDIDAVDDRMIPAGEAGDEGADEAGDTGDTAEPAATDIAATEPAAADETFVGPPVPPPAEGGD